MEGNGKAFAPFVAQCFLEHARPLRVRSCRRAPEAIARSQAPGVAMPFAASINASSPASFSLTKRLDEIDGRTPLPARARLEQTLKIAVQQVSGLEADHLGIRQRAKLLP